MLCLSKTYWSGLNPAPFTEIWILKSKTLLIWYIHLKVVQSIRIADRFINPTACWQKTSVAIQFRRVTRCQQRNSKKYKNQPAAPKSMNYCSSHFCRKWSGETVTDLQGSLPVDWPHYHRACQPCTIAVTTCLEPNRPIQSFTLKLYCTPHENITLCRHAFNILCSVIHNLMLYKKCARGHNLFTNNITNKRIKAAADCRTKYTYCRQLEITVTFIQSQASHSNFKLSLSAVFVSYDDLCVWLVSILMMVLVFFVILIMKKIIIPKTACNHSIWHFI